MEDRLIPGLPDCVARHCLLHLPFHAIPAVRTVCKRWNHELTSPSFYRLRRATGHDHCVITLIVRGKLSHTVDKLHLALYEPATGICMIRQLTANRTNNLDRCSRGFIFGRELLVIGGWDLLNNSPTGEVRVYDLFSGAWRTGAPMPAPELPLCKFGLREGKVFMVGGIDAEGKKLRSVLFYDMGIDMWLEVPDLEQDTCQGSLYDKFWRCKEEYNRAMRRCEKLWLVADEEYMVKFNLTTMEEKEIMVLDLPKIKLEPDEKVKERVILSTQALETLQRQLGLLPNEISLYIDSFHMGQL